jgi:hypothetical protein
MEFGQQDAIRYAQYIKLGSLVELAPYCQEAKIDGRLN